MPSTPRWTALLACAAAACSNSMAASMNPDAPGTGGDAASGDAAQGGPSATALLGAIAGCPTMAGGKFATDEGGTQNISICATTNGVALYWAADLDVDCDGKTTTQCNLQTDPAYQNQTSATDSHGAPLDAATLPYVVVPSTSTRFDFQAAGLDLGSVVAVIYQGHVQYGVIGDTGPTTIIGEASYRMAQLLGIDPDPSTGGTDSGVSYIAFVGAAGQVNVIEDHAEAVTVGTARATALLGP